MSSDRRSVSLAFGSAGEALALPWDTTLRQITLAASWMTLLVEGAVGGLHAIRAPRLYMARHLALMTFILGTYLLLPVIGFAFVLTVLGLAQCHERDTAMRLRYLALLCLVQFTIVPWGPR